MNKAYLEAINNIKSLISEEKYIEANFILNEELSQPYIPSDVEEVLISLKKDLNYYLVEDKNYKNIDIDKILRMLKGNEKSQLYAANLLCDIDLKEVIDEIKDYLAKDPCPEAASLIIDKIAKQKIDEEFIYKKNGLEYIFEGSLVDPVEESDGFKKALELLNNYLCNDYPYMLELTRPALVHYAYTLLPLSLEEEEANEIVLSIIKDVSDIIDDGKTYKEIST